MRSTSETGHYKNITNYESMFDAIKKFDPPYDPKKVELGIPANEQLIIRTRTSFTELSKTTAVQTTATHEKQEGFAILKNNLTPINAAIRNSTMIDADKEHAFAIIRKMRGVINPNTIIARAKKTAVKLLSNDTSKTGKSTSQMSYYGQLKNFEELYIFLEQTGKYDPENASTTITELKKLYQKLHTLCQTESNAIIETDQKRLERNNLLYKEQTGLVPIAFKIKDAVLDIYGNKSNEYKQIKGIPFIMYSKG